MVGHVGCNDRVPGPRAVPGSQRSPGHKETEVQFGAPISVAHAASPGRLAVVRLRGCRDRTVRVRSLAVKSREVLNCNCVAERRGGEQRNENDQTGTQDSRVAVRRELDSVGVAGRAFDRVAKPVARAIGQKLSRRTARKPLADTLMVGDGMVGSPCDRNQGGPPGPKRCSWPGVARRTARRETERP